MVLSQCGIPVLKGGGSERRGQVSKMELSCGAARDTLEQGLKLLFWKRTHFVSVC
jgi:hypothetical protein